MTPRESGFPGRVRAPVAHSRASHRRVVRRSGIGAETATGKAPGRFGCVQGPRRND